jgi:hypothetical protein
MPTPGPRTTMTTTSLPSEAIVGPATVRTPIADRFVFHGTVTDADLAYAVSFVAEDVLREAARSLSHASWVYWIEFLERPTVYGLHRMIWRATSFRQLSDLIERLPQRLACRVIAVIDAFGLPPELPEGRP